MPLVQTNAGDIRVLKVIVDEWNASAFLTFHLAQAPWTPSEATVVGDFEEADFSGYAAQAASGWTDPVTVADRAQTSADPLIWTRTITGAAQTIYGYWVEMNGYPGVVVWSEMFQTAVTLTNADEALVLYPQYTLDTE